MTHWCRARGCSTQVPPKMLMCKRHWFKVPKPIRDAIWATYVPRARKISREHLQNMRAAIDAVGTGP